MAIKFDAPDSLPAGGGNWIDKPGTYHLTITATEEEPISKKDKKLVDGFTVDFQAMEGTVRDSEGKFTEKDKTISLTFYNPKLTDKNEGMFARQKQAAFFVASGLMTEEQLGKSGIEIKLADARGRQVIATLEEQTGTDGKKYIRLAYGDIFHIDDPRAAGFPRNEKAITLIPSAHRRDPKSFKIGEDDATTKAKDPPKENGSNGVDMDDL